MAKIWMLRSLASGGQRCCWWVDATIHLPFLCLFIGFLPRSSETISLSFFCVIWVGQCLAVHLCKSFRRWFRTLPPHVSYESFDRFYDYSRVPNRDETSAILVCRFYRGILLQSEEEKPKDKEEKDEEKEEKDNAAGWDVLGITWHWTLPPLDFSSGAVYECICI